jgi:hypothetical protein
MMFFWPSTIPPAIIFDNTGNIYLAGIFTGTVNFGGSDLVIRPLIILTAWRLITQMILSSPELLGEASILAAQISKPRIQYLIYIW